MLKHGDPNKLHVYLERQNDSQFMLEMGLVPLECEMLLPDWRDWKPNLVLEG